MKTKIGSGGRILFLIVAIIQVTMVIVCLVLAVLYNYNFFLPILALVPGILLVSSFGFVSFEEGYFVIKRLFRGTIKIHASEYKNVSQSFLSVPFSNTLKILFRDGREYSFLGGGRSLNQIREQLYLCLNTK